MSNFGFADLRVVAPYEVAFREARSAVGASATLRDARQCASVPEAVADCALVVGTASGGARELKHPLRRLEYGARLIHKAMPSGRVAVLFGSEKHGLSNDDISYCHWLMRIPTRAEHESMNLGQSVAVCLYELARSPAAARKQPKAVAAAGGRQLALVEERLIEVLRAADFPFTPSTATQIRRLLRRAGFTAADADVWLGIFRQVLWKLSAR